VNDQQNFLVEGLKQVVREAVREEIGKVQPSKPEKLLLNTKEAAELLNIKDTWLAEAAREGRIKSVKVGHYVRFARGDLEAFILQMKNQGEKT
jgi:excisionase family DNA binding protein